MSPIQQLASALATLGVNVSAVTLEQAARIAGVGIMPGISQAVSEHLAVHARLGARTVG